MSDLAASVRSNLSRLREARGVSIRALSRKTDGKVSHATIANIESGAYASLRSSTLEALAKALGVEIADLIAGPKGASRRSAAKGAASERGRR